MSELLYRLAFQVQALNLFSRALPIAKFFEVSFLANKGTNYFEKTQKYEHVLILLESVDAGFLHFEVYNC